MAQKRKHGKNYDPADDWDAQNTPMTTGTFMHGLLPKGQFLWIDFVIGFLGSMTVTFLLNLVLGLIDLSGLMAAFLYLFLFVGTICATYQNKPGIALGILLQIILQFLIVAYYLSLWGGSISVALSEIFLSYNLGR